VQQVDSLGTYLLQTMVTSQNGKMIGQSATHRPPPCRCGQNVGRGQRRARSLVQPAGSFVVTRHIRYSVGQWKSSLRDGCGQAIIAECNLLTGDDLIWVEACVCLGNKSMVYLTFSSSSKCLNTRRLFILKC